MSFLLLAFACTSPDKIPEGAVGDRLVVTKGLYQQVPLMWDGIIEAGFIGSPECQDRMGQHAIWEVDGLAVTEFVFNLRGNLIGVEVISEADEPVPPWDMSGSGEPEGDNNKIHTFFGDHETACEVDAAEPVGLGDRVVMSWGSFTDMSPTTDDAVAQGWVVSEDCIDGEGVYAHKEEEVAGKPWPIRQIFNTAGTLIGVEISSWSEQVINPWSSPEADGDPWTYHMWFQDPMMACRW